MRKIIKRLRASTDIKDIWRYTFDEWGEIQANSYLKSMEECLVGLAQSPKRGSAVVHQQAGLRQYRYKKHLIVSIFILKQRSISCAHYISAWILRAINYNNPPLSPTTAPRKALKRPCSLSLRDGLRSLDYLSPWLQWAEKYIMHFLTKNQKVLNLNRKVIVIGLLMAHILPFGLRMLVTWMSF